MNQAGKTACGVAVVLAALAGTSGCSSAGTSGQQPPTTAPTISPPRQPPDPTPELQKQLGDAVTRYEQVNNAVYSNPRQDLSVVDTVATGQGADSLKSQARQVADQHLTVTGAIKVIRVSVVRVDPDPPVPSAPATATVKACNDVSTTTVTTPDGKSDVDPKRGPQTQTVLALTNPTPSNPATWLVATSELATSPCDPT
jgi:hypothetical protein